MSGRKLFSAVCSIAIICPLLACCARKSDNSLQTTTVQHTEQVTQLSTEPTEPETESTAATAAPSTATVTTTEIIRTTSTTKKVTTTKAAPTTARKTTLASTTKKTTSTAKATTTAKRVSTAEFENEVIRLINAQRRKAGVGELEFSSGLYDAAQIREREIKQKFSHTRPNGSDCFSVSELVMGENIAAGQTSPEDVVNVWMNSQAHRENILRERFKITAVGCYYDSGNDTYYWVQLFG